MAGNKIFPSREEALADVFDGATIMIGGYAGWAGIPIGLINTLYRKKTKNLTIIAVNAGGQIKYPNGDWADIACLGENNQVKKVICCWAKGIGLTGEKMGPISSQILEGKVELEMVPQGSLVERIRIGGAGIGGFLTKVGLGTPIEETRQKVTVNGEEYLLELPLKADFTLMRARKADEMGNLIYHGSARGISHSVATAAKTTIVEVEEIVPVGALDPDTVHTPSIYIDRIVKIASDEIMWRRTVNEGEIIWAPKSA